MALMQSLQILHFWFTELTPQQHFAKDAALDESIRTRFGPTPVSYTHLTLPTICSV